MEKGKGPTSVHEVVIPVPSFHELLKKVIVEEGLLALLYKKLLGAILKTEFRDKFSATIIRLPADGDKAFTFGSVADFREKMHIE